MKEKKIDGYRGWNMSEAELDKLIDNIEMPTTLEEDIAAHDNLFSQLLTMIEKGEAGPEDYDQQIDCIEISINLIRTKLGVKED